MFFKDEPKKENESINIMLSTRQASLLLAAALLVLFFSFITGYFWGKQNSISQFCMSVEQSSFADRIYSSMCEISETEVPASSETAPAPDAPETPEIQEVVQEEQVEQVASHDDLAGQTTCQPQPRELHHAQLAGYGSKAQADKFAQKLNKKGIPVQVETRKSKSSKGKVKSWYQVVTENFANKEELEKLVARISKEEKLSGVRIVRS